MYTKSINDGWDIPVTGVFGVQQPNVQMLMSALQIGTHWDEEEKDIQTQIHDNWNSLPETWKEPYRTGEVTLFDILIDSQFDKEYYEKLEPEKRHEYARNMLQIRIRRNAHTETYDMIALDTYKEVVETFKPQ